MVEVKFYDTVNDELLKFAVIISQSNGKWVFCKHKERDTYEVPGGHREDGEDILETAKRELYEETGAITFDITPICIYSVTAPDNFDGMETFGKLFLSMTDPNMRRLLEIAVQKRTENDGECQHYAIMRRFKIKDSEEVESIKKVLKE